MITKTALVNIVTTLQNADALEIDGNFIRHFNFSNEVDGDDVSLDAGDYFQFTKAQLDASVFDESSNQWQIKNYAGGSFALEVFSVKKLTPPIILLNNSPFSIQNETQAVSIVLPFNIKTSINTMLCDKCASVTDCSSYIIDIQELLQLDNEQITVFQSHFEFLVSALSDFTKSPQKEIEAILKSVSYLEII